MAFSIEILGIRWERGQYALQRAAGCLGDARALMRDPRFREVASQPGYLDVVAVLSVGEALALASASPPPSAGVGAYEAFAQSLAGAAFVLVHVFEWDSGL
jgi:hypothetical protein